MNLNLSGIEAFVKTGLINAKKCQFTLCREKNKIMQGTISLIRRNTHFKRGHFIVEVTSQSFKVANEQLGAIMNE